MGRRGMLAALLGAAICCAAPLHAQIRRPGPRVAKKAGARKGIVPRNPQARRSAPNAEDFIMRLVQQPPERRREILAKNQRFQKLPRRQRQRILDRLKQIDEMKPQERAQLVERYNLFSRLEPAKRERARELYQDWVKIPSTRRRMMTQAVARLRRLDPARRPAALESQGFTSRFTEDERKLIGEIVEIAPGPAN